MEILSQQNCLSWLNSAKDSISIHQKSCSPSSLRRTDHVALFDVMLKTASARLDSKPYNHVAEALHLVRETILDMELNDVSDASGRNFKFQVDQLLPNLQTVFLDSKTGAKLSRSSKVDRELN